MRSKHTTTRLSAATFLPKLSTSTFMISATLSQLLAVQAMSTGLPPGVPPGTKVFGPGANCTLEICPIDISVYGYRPSLAANITFLCLYFCMASIHIYLGVRWRTWFFMGCMIFGAINAIIGYAGRIAMWYNPFNFVAFMIQIVCITSGPVYYSASIYVTLAAAVKHFSPGLSRLSPNLFYWIFIPSDVVCLILQAAGGALATASAGTSQAGIDLALVGLSLQVLVMIVFCILFADYVIRYSRNSSTAKFDFRCKLFFGFMSLAIVLILTRCAYRLVELRDGYGGSLVKDESLFIGLEGVLVVLAVVCLMVGHPGLVFKESRKGVSVPLVSLDDECPSENPSRTAQR